MFSHDHHFIRTSVIPTSRPIAEVISLDFMKNYLHQTSNTDDQLIYALIVAAREYAEKRTWRSLSKKNYVQYMDRFPGFRQGGAFHQRDLAIKLWYPPLVNVDSIVYVDLSGNDVVMRSGQDFQVDYALEPGRVAPLQDQIWPMTLRGVQNAVRIYFTAGYEVMSTFVPPGQVDEPDQNEPEQNVAFSPGTAQVSSYSVDRTIPEPLAIGIMQAVTLWYQNRDPIIAQPGAGGKFSILPGHMQELFDAYRCFDFCLTQ